MALSPGAIAGIVVASIFGLILLLAFLAVILLVRLQPSSDSDHSVGFALPLGPLEPIVRLFAPGRRAENVQSYAAPELSSEEQYQLAPSESSLVDSGSMQVKGVRDVYEDRELGERK
ncbi:hypothetical protein BKA63DRAFT_562046 [Paraphoma chrysanthemicola]|nr:hypothetical protein BKA63DRAFT_562046 [Paraphoma chrysanthemicola]